jgi:hypothetical protein
MPGVLRVAEASPVRIYALLPTDDDLINNSRLTWSEALRLGQHDKMLGDISSADDVLLLPPGILLKAIGFVAAGITTIRWLDPGKASRVLAGVNHDHLLCRGDQPEETRSGWLLRTGDEVVVQ